RPFLPTFWHSPRGEWCQILALSSPHSPVMSESEDNSIIVLLPDADDESIDGITDPVTVAPTAGHSSEEATPEGEGSTSNEPAQDGDEERATGAEDVIDGDKGSQLSGWDEEELGEKATTHESQAAEKRKKEAAKAQQER
ncbi:unnamed protein product, partial [Chrysoparadoxa australica]